MISISHLRVIIVQLINSIIIFGDHEEYLSKISFLSYYFAMILLYLAVSEYINKMQMKITLILN